MDLTHTFTVPATLDETWRTFTDIADVANCFPGASVTSAEADEFHGSVKVKLGPIAMLYNGSGTFLERDEAAHRFVVDAKGKDRRGNGTAAARVTATMAQAGEQSTLVTVLTDLSITGKPAQFGRGMIQDVSDKLLQQFVTCLESKVGASPEAEAPAGAAAPAVGAPAGAPAEPPVVESVKGTAAPPRTDALDLGATVLPILLKAYWKPLAGALLVMVVIRWLRRLRS